MFELQSDESRTNQLKITNKDYEIWGDNIFQWLFQRNMAIGSFSVDDDGDYKIPKAKKEEDDSESKFHRKYKARHQYIKKEIQKRNSQIGVSQKLSQVEYSLYGRMVFYLVPTNKRASSKWIKDFKSPSEDGVRVRERILNLVFKLYLLQNHLIDLMPEDNCLTGLEQLVLIHAKERDENGTLMVYGYSISFIYNKYETVSLRLQNKGYKVGNGLHATFDSGGDMGDITISGKDYSFEKKLDGRANQPPFVIFPQESRYPIYEDRVRAFSKCKLYLFQAAMDQLIAFFEECKIPVQELPFSATHYIDSPFLREKNIKCNLKPLMILNNTGQDFSESKKDFLMAVLNNMGYSSVSYFEDGATINTYKMGRWVDEAFVPEEEYKAPDKNHRKVWDISEQIPWDSIKLTADYAYLVFNKILKKSGQGSSVAQLDDEHDGYWTLPKKEIKKGCRKDFYTTLRGKALEINKSTTNELVCIQGINADAWEEIKHRSQKKYAIFTLTDPKAKANDIEEFDMPYQVLSQLKKRNCRKPFDPKKDLDAPVKFSPEFDKALSELYYKMWFAEALDTKDIFSKAFFDTQIDNRLYPIKPFKFESVFTRTPRGGDTEIAVVQFRYENGVIYVENKYCDTQKAEEEYGQCFQRITRGKNARRILDGQKLLVDRQRRIYVTGYWSINYSPTLIGHPNLMASIKEGTAELKKTKPDPMLPIVRYFSLDPQKNKQITTAAKNLVYLDLSNENFIQYFVPPKMGPQFEIAKGFTVYHLMGFTFENKKINLKTADLINDPLVTIFLHTLTTDMLRISENSKTSFLHKLPRIIIEN